MGYDGKIKNGIELKESEGNLFQRIIIKILKKLKGDSEVWYSLSYDEEKHRYFDKNYILSYLRDNYLNNKDDIEPTKISNDLITFKTYRDQLVFQKQNSSLFEKILTSSFAIVSILIAIGFGFLNLKDVIGKTLTANIFNDILYTIKLLLITYVIYIIFYTWRINNNLKLNRLKVINNAIYTLETIKEDMYRIDNSGTESDERYEGLELTEVKEIRTYAYKATGNKYSPRAMHHRKIH